MAAYYNEIDPYAAQWLRNLIAAGHIADGEVDERSIEDVKPEELKGFKQCHFFAGIGVWSYALRQAGWSDDKPVWSGSCPCQPFSAAGKRAGFADERHLWPAFFHLIQQCKPAVVFGEQIASKDAEAWVDLVQVDLEAVGYSFGAIPFPAASVGAPHIRDRLYWVGDSISKGLEGLTGDGSQAGRAGTTRPTAKAGLHDSQPSSDRKVNGFWRNADWLRCRDGLWRAVEPGYEQMADGSARSLGRVRTCAVEEIEGQIGEWSIRHQTDGGEGLRRVWGDLQSQALCEREIGRFSGVQSPTVLLAFLRQLAEQGWRFSDTLVCSRTEASEIVVRVLQFDPQAARTPLRRELAEQCTREPADALQELSSLLAHHAAQCWGEACREKTGAASFPLADRPTSRVGRLRAYGNAINAEAAKAFIESYLEL